MTINDIARMMISRDRYQNQMSQPKLQNGSLPPEGHVNPYCPEGMNITGMKESDFKIIPVSKEIETKMKDMAFQNMKKYYGMTASSGNEYGDSIFAYALTIPPQDRAHAAYTLHQIHREEANRLQDFVKSRVPGWQVGQPFDTGILDAYRQGIDVKA
ncbi:DUF3879 family protein [Acutalibacter caecimuris]|uniref:DUF3879 family protein n=1 Tax=Acutalibacter caecimuris TaxID=3093657 RepID=UPI002AC919FD|nr:DUF3879 family protein [Acutalibacter sp. M00118]